MIYVMSDIHGKREKFLKMLELISFSESDELFILGDIIDRGPDPVGLLQDIHGMRNVHNIIGNHELMAIDILKTLLVEITEKNYATQITTEILMNMMDWQMNGGNTTITGFRRLPIEVRLDLVNFMESFVPYESVHVNGNTFILVHSGLGNYVPGKLLSEYSLEELVFIRPSYSDTVFEDEDIRIICGHTPTLAITGKPEIYYEKSYINIDCGACFEGGKLACLRLDDLQEYYV